MSRALLGGWLLAAVACGEVGLAPGPDGGAPPDGAPAVDAPVTVQVLPPGEPDTADRVLVHDAGGRFVRALPLDDTGRATIEAMPAGGIVTVALARGESRWLESRYDVRPGEALVVRRPGSKLPGVTIAYRLPALPEPGNDRPAESARRVTAPRRSCRCR